MSQIKILSIGIGNCAKKASDRLENLFKMAVTSVSLCKIKDHCESIYEHQKNCFDTSFIPEDHHNQESSNNISSSSVVMKMKDMDILLLLIDPGEATAFNEDISFILKEASDRKLAAIVIKLKQYCEDENLKNNSANPMAPEEVFGFIAEVDNTKQKNTLEGASCITLSSSDEDAIFFTAVPVLYSILQTGCIGFDFADLKMLFSYGKSVMAGFGLGQGDNYAESAIKKAFSSPLIWPEKARKAKGMLLYLRAFPAMPVINFEKAIEAALRYTLDDIDLKVGGLVFEDSIPADTMEAYVVLTGFDKN